MIIKKFIIGIALGCTAILYGGYLIATPIIANNPKFESFVEQTIQQQTGWHIDFINPNIQAGFIPSLIFKADEINIKNEDGTPVFRAVTPYMKIQLLPILRKRIVIRKSGMSELQAKLIYGKDSLFYIGQYPIKLQNNNLFILQRLSSNIGKYDITLDDKKNDKKLEFYGDFLSLRKYKKDKLISFSTNTKLHCENKISIIDTDIELSLPLNKITEDKININAKIENLNLADFSSYANTLTNGKIKELRGIVNYHSNTSKSSGHKNIKSILEIDKLGIMQKDRASSIYSDYLLSIDTDINVINDGIKINSLKILSKDLEATVTGWIHKTKEKFPNLDLKATVNKASGETLLPLFPGEENLNPDFNFYKLKEHMIYGHGTGNMEIKGVANYPNLYGNILLKDVYLNEPIKDAPQKGIVKLNFNKHTMNIDVHVMTNKNEWVDVTGSFKLFRERVSDIKIKTTKNIELVKAKKVLIPLKEIFKFELGPVPMMNIDSGLGNADFRVAGSKIEPHSWGIINFNNASASFIKINNMDVKKITGWVKLNDEDVTFKTTSSYLNGLPVDISGECDLQGNMSVDVIAEGQDSSNLFKIINTSPILKELQDMLKPVTTASGKTKIILNIFGHVDRGKEPIFNKDLFAKGSVEFFNNVMTFFPQKVPASNINGTVNFDRKDGNFNINAKLVNSQISTNGVINNKICTANAYSNKFNAGDWWHIARLFYGKKVPHIPGINSISTSFSGHYKGAMNLDKFDYRKITAKGKVYSNFGSKSPIFVNNSDFDIRDGHFHISQIIGILKGNPFNLQVDIDNIMTEKQVYNGSGSMKNFDISVFNDLKIPEYPQLNDFEDFNGKIDIASKIRNNNLRVFIQPTNGSVVYKPKRLKIKFQSGNLLFDTDSVNLNKLTAYFGEMPVFFNGKIKNIFSDNPDFNLYINAKPTQEFFDQFFNSNSVYPIKLKGDVILSSKLNGPLNRLNAKTDLKLDESSSIYYMGATIGDLINPVNVNIDSISGKDWIRLNNFKYDKVIASQNGKRNSNTQLKASGNIKLLANNNMSFNNFRVKTETPTDAKIFNIIFKKPFMKQGLFNSDLVINGDTRNPKILGTLDLTSIDVPIVDASVKDVSFNFKQDNIYVKAKSSVLDNQILLDAAVKNKLTPPYIINDINVHFDNLDLNVITDAIQDYDTTLYRQKVGVDDSTKGFNPKQIIIKKGTIKANTLKIQNLTAENLIAHLFVNNNAIANLKDFSVQVASGKIDGNMQYDLIKQNLILNAFMHNADAQNLADNLFNMKGQLYGNINGKLNINCNGSSDLNCINTLNGKGDFTVSNGRMPKLGSLEYLLKATNIVTSGITRISINNILELITPLKTGNFRSIKGKFTLNNGIAKNIEIFSKGNDLNLYLSGSYNIENSNAKMEVYGTLSNNLTSVFGKLKNLSLNTLLNTIPFLNNNEQSPEIEAKIKKIPKDENFSISRIFAAEIDGDINGFNYVKSFKWVK